VKDRIYEFARFVRHLGTYYRSHMLAHQGLIRRRVDEAFNDPHVLFVTRDLFVVCPERVSTYATWRWYSSSLEGRREIPMFLRLRQGSKRFLDVGGAEGMMSAMYAQSATEPCRILAIEPQDVLYRLHQETIARNSADGNGKIDWSVYRLALLDKEGPISYASPVFGGLFDHSGDVTDFSLPLRATTLEAFCQATNYEPDFIKMDIESFEHEVLLSSLPFLRALRPKLHLELHSRMIEKRGHSPTTLLQSLEPLYRVVAAFPRNYQAADIARLAMVPK
jgi:FkbM family methyltransferase